MGSNKLGLFETLTNSNFPGKSDKLHCLRTFDAEELVEELDDSRRPEVSDLPFKNEVNASKHEWLVIDGTILKEDLWQKENQHTPLVLGKSNFCGLRKNCCFWLNNFFFVSIKPGTTAHSEASPQLWEKLQKIQGPREEAIAEHIKSSYIGDLGMTDEVLKLYNSSWEGLTAMISDIRTICPALNFIKKQVPF